jgi:putative transcriptional regulator|tara:strand:+ start:2116 stop:2673 length:558 start_codon:yes stop_codon:yes gene_type:complete
MSDLSLRNNFLIAMPSLEDTFFGRSVTLMCEHSNEGAMGIVINQPVDVKHKALFDQLDLDAPSTPTAFPIVAGGPVQQDRGFVIHRPGGQWRSSIILGDRIAITTSLDILEAISKGYGPTEALIALGYAGWDSGQLEQEISDNSWLNTPVSTEIIFDTPFDERWQHATEMLGIDIHQLTGDCGHG